MGSSSQNFRARDAAVGATRGCDELLQRPLSAAFSRGVVQPSLESILAPARRRQVSFMYSLTVPGRYARAMRESAPPRARCAAASSGFDDRVGLTFPGNQHSDMPCSSSIIDGQRQTFPAPAAGFLGPATHPPGPPAPDSIAEGPSQPPRVGGGRGVEVPAAFRTS